MIVYLKLFLLDVVMYKFITQNAKKYFSEQQVTVEASCEWMNGLPELSDWLILLCLNRIDFQCYSAISSVQLAICFRYKLHWYFWCRKDEYEIINWSENTDGFQSQIIFSRTNQMTVFVLYRILRPKTNRKQNGSPIL